MSLWAALVPLRPAGQRKTRLAPVLDAARRDALAEGLLRGVTAALGAAPEIGEILLLCAEKPAFWRSGWLPDGGCGLNQELEMARRALGADRLIVIHADLPFVTPADITALTHAARAGCALAPDRAGFGTNAVALRGVADFSFRFGADSLSRHEAQAGEAGRLVRRFGLAFDIDTPDDLAAAVAQGFRP